MDVPYPNGQYRGEGYGINVTANMEIKIVPKIPGADTETDIDTETKTEIEPDLSCPSGSLEGKFKATSYGDNHYEFWSKVWQQDPSDIYDGNYLATIIEPTLSNSNWTWTYGI